MDRANWQEVPRIVAEVRSRLRHASGMIGGVRGWTGRGRDSNERERAHWGLLSAQSLLGAGCCCTSMSRTKPNGVNPVQVLHSQTDRVVNADELKN